MATSASVHDWKIQVAIYICVVALGLASVVGVLAALESGRVHHSERETFELIKKLKGSCAVNSDDGRRITVVDLSNSPVTDADLHQFQSLPTLRELRLNDTQISDEGLKNIAPMESLERLHIRNTAITDSGIQALVGMKRLFDIDTNGSKVSRDAYYRLLEQLPATGLAKK